MSEWRDRVDDLLYSGETLVESVEFDGASVVVTSHRMLAFDPDGDGATFRQVDRPNIEGVSADAQSDTALLGRGLKTFVVGIVLVGTGLVFDFGSIVGDTSLGGQSSQELGIGGILGTLQQFLNLLAQLDFLLRVFGGLALFLAVVFFGVYWLTRDRTLRIAVAGGEDIHLPRPRSDADEYAARLEALVAPGEAGSSDIGERVPQPSSGKT